MSAWVAGYVLSWLLTYTCLVTQTEEATALALASAVLLTLAARRYAHTRAMQRELHRAERGLRELECYMLHR
jgi:Tfp pilus assembly protein PilX